MSDVTKLALLFKIKVDFKRKIKFILRKNRLIRKINGN